MLVVNAYSRQSAPAIELVMYLTSAAEQKRRAIEGGYNPTMPALYRDEDVVRAAPYLQTLYSTFAQAVARPSMQSGAKYNRVSIEFANAVHGVLANEDNADDAMATLERRLKRVRRGGKW
jgi:trehalose/maltose transport system substrate-binding protein